MRDYLASLVARASGAGPLLRPRRATTYDPGAPGAIERPEESHPPGAVPTRPPPESRPTDASRASAGPTGRTSPRPQAGPEPEPEPDSGLGAGSPSRLASPAAPVIRASAEAKAFTVRKIIESVGDPGGAPRGEGWSEEHRRPVGAGAGTPAMPAPPPAGEVPPSLAGSRLRPRPVTSARRGGSEADPPQVGPGRGEIVPGTAGRGGRGPGAPIEITIGRVEVRAEVAPGRPAAGGVGPRPPNVLTLEEHLRRRAGESQP